MAEVFQSIQREVAFYPRPDLIATTFQAVNQCYHSYHFAAFSLCPIYRLEYGTTSGHNVVYDDNARPFWGSIFHKISCAVVLGLLPNIKSVKRNPALSGLHHDSTDDGIGSVSESADCLNFFRQGLNCVEDCLTD